MNTQATPERSLIRTMAARYSMEAGAFASTVKAMCMPKEASSNEHFAAFLLVANEHGLNPMTHEIYAMWSKKHGKLSVVVGIDGWMSLINRRPEFDGMAFVDSFDKAGIIDAITCRIYRKDRAHPIEVTEYLEECRQDTDTWRKWPVRMLRHKAAIQCARYAFAISGIIDPDEFDRFGGDRQAPISAPQSPPPVNQNVEIPSIPSVPGLKLDRTIPSDLSQLPELSEVVIDEATPSEVDEWLGRIEAATYDEAVTIIEREVYPAHEEGRISEVEKEELIEAVMKKPYRG